jgi:hypothetical protein
MFLKNLWRKLSKKKSPTRRPHTLPVKETQEPTSVEYWVARLTARLARMQRFRELDAPATIVAAEQRLIDQAIARLGPGRALSIMREWRELQRVIDPEAASKRPTTERRRYAEPN